MLLPVSCYSTSRHPCQWFESCYVCVQVPILLDMLYPLSTLPEHIHSTILSYAKITCKTHTQPKENCFHPSYARSLITTPSTHPLHWESRLHSPKPVIPVFGAAMRRLSVAPSLLLCVCLWSWCQSYRCLYCLFLLETFSD